MHSSQPMCKFMSQDVSRRDLIVTIVYLEMQINPNNSISRIPLDMRHTHKMA